MPISFTTSDVTFNKINNVLALFFSPPTRILRRKELNTRKTVAIISLSPLFIHPLLPL